MNNQEAIEIIEAIIDGIVSGQTSYIPRAEWHSALKKAVESLKENEWVPMETNAEGEILNRLYKDRQTLSTDHRSIGADKRRSRWKIDLS